MLLGLARKSSRDNIWIKAGTFGSRKRSDLCSGSRKTDNPREKKEAPMKYLTRRRTTKQGFRFTTHLVAPAIGFGLILLVAEFAHAGGATWAANPISGEWNNAANWTPMSVPGQGGVGEATFALSNTTKVSVLAD